MTDGTEGPTISPATTSETATFHQTLVENASEGLLTIDSDSQIVHANPAIEEILGYTPEELIGSSKMTIIPERLRPVHADALASYLESNEKHIDWNGIELPALHKDGHEVPTLISLREHSHGGERFFTGIIRDISERKRQQAELQRERERLEEFASILAHDIKNPLQAAQGYTHMARADADSRELEQVAEALQRIEELVDDVLALSREGVDIGAVEKLSLKHHIREAWDELVADGATLVIENDLGSIEADGSRLYALLSNVLRNAIEHAGSTVTIRVGRLPSAKGFYIEDDGPGIPESVATVAFEHGYSTRKGGTGYGLTIVSRIASAHGWETTITKGAEGGARFEFAGVSMSEVPQPEPSDRQFR